MKRNSNRSSDESSSKVPKTSSTMLREMMADSRAARWTDFVARYRPMMEAYLAANYPTIDADEIISATLIALMKALPNYCYAPDERGAFHNYLTGILRNQARRWAWSEKRRAERLEKYAAKRVEEGRAGSDEESRWREAVYELALQQLLADTSFEPRSREVFRRVAVNGEKPDAVAESLGLNRNAVDQMKARLLRRLREYVAALEQADDGRIDSF